jgi:DNA repair protein RadA/Sms
LRLQKKQKAKTLTLTYSDPVLLNSVDIEVENRCKTGIEEFDRVLGGGIVNSSVIL